MENSTTWATRIPNRLGDLMRAIEALDRCLGQWGADANARYLAQFAVEELGTNIIKYGYDDQGEHTIHLGAACEENLFRISLEDDGHEFNPCLSPEPDPELSLEERTPGGWGLSLVRRMLAGLEYERRDGRNVVTVLVSRVPVAES
jgi:serine/threonine-protein kinase RsbW